MTDETRELAESGEAVDSAYELAVKSYDWALKRWDSVNILFTGLVAIAVPLTLAVPILTKTLGLEICSWWLIGVGVLFAAVLACCVAGRLFGDIRLIDPTILYEDYLECSRREFQKSMIYYAGRHYNHSVNVIYRKWWWARSAAILLSVEGAVVFCAVVL